MDIAKESVGSSLKIALSGRLDTTTVPVLDAELKSSLDGITNLVFDFAQLEYISSAGLRLILSAQKSMNAVKGSMVIKNVIDEIKEVFDMTGFSDIITIE